MGCTYKSSHHIVHLPTILIIMFPTICSMQQANPLYSWMLTLKSVSLQTSNHQTLDSSHPATEVFIFLNFKLNDGLKAYLTIYYIKNQRRRKMVHLDKKELFIAMQWNDVVLRNVKLGNCWLVIRKRPTQIIKSPQLHFCNKKQFHSYNIIFTKEPKIELEYYRKLNRTQNLKVSQNCVVSA